MQLKSATSELRRELLFLDLGAYRVQPSWRVAVVLRRFADLYQTHASELLGELRLTEIRTDQIQGQSACRDIPLNAAGDRSLYSSAVALGLTRVVARLLYGIGANDPVTMLSVVTLLGAMSLLACYFPARRAMLRNPVTAIREL